VQVYAIVGLGIVTPDNLRRTETCSRKRRIALDARAHIRLDRACGCAQDNLVILGQSDSQSISSSDGDRPFRDQLKHFVQNELLALFKLTGACNHLEPLVACSQCSAIPHLLMQRRKCQESLKGIAPRRPRLWRFAQIGRREIIGISATLRRRRSISRPGGHARLRKAGGNFTDRFGGSRCHSVLDGPSARGSVAICASPCQLTTW